MACFGTQLQLAGDDWSQRLAFIRILGFQSITGKPRFACLAGMSLLSQHHSRLNELDGFGGLVGLMSVDRAGTSGFSQNPLAGKIR